MNGKIAMALVLALLSGVGSCGAGESVPTPRGRAGIRKYTQTGSGNVIDCDSRSAGDVVNKGADQ
ncbi:hypothetical protein [uncultured Alistipes sp.]|uniref:hypothetical protein n=1 Tax=uncultured Alistipes sp. TaxID=538949 RepID=UPI002614D48B|nr:hypothetical protein [uncultured Alistipes sp.]